MAEGTFLKGTIKSIGPMEVKSDKFKYIDLVLDCPDKNEKTGATYPNIVGIQFANANADKLSQFGVGQQVSIGYSLKGREYQGRVITNVIGWFIKAEEGSTTSAPSNNSGSTYKAPVQPVQSAPVDDSQDSLPF